MYDHPSQIATGSPGGDIPCGYKVYGYVLIVAAAVVAVKIFKKASSYDFAISAVDVDADTISIPDHRYNPYMIVRMTTSTADLPAPLATGTDYWVIVADDGSIQLASSLANAIAGTAINITDVGTGTHTIVGPLLWEDEVVAADLGKPFAFENPVGDPKGRACVFTVTGAGGVVKLQFD